MVLNNKLKSSLIPIPNSERHNVKKLLCCVLIFAGNLEQFAIREVNYNPSGFPLARDNLHLGAIRLIVHDVNLFVFPSVGFGRRRYLLGRIV
jgi:hypothetical protein